MGWRGTQGAYSDARIRSIDQTHHRPARRPAAQPTRVGRCPAFPQELPGGLAESHEYPLMS